MSKIYIDNYLNNVDVSLDKNLIEDIIRIQLKKELEKPIRSRIQHAVEKINEEYIDEIIENILPKLVVSMVEDKVKASIGIKSTSSYSSDMNITSSSTLHKMINDLIKETAENKIEEIFSKKETAIVQTVKESLDGRSYDIQNIPNYVRDRVREQLKAKISQMADLFVRNLLNENS